MLTDIYLESGRSPTTNGLNDMRGDPSLSKGRGATCAQGVASHVTREVGAEPTDEPAASGYRTVFTEPQLGVEWETPIARAQVLAKGSIGVVVRRVTLEYDTISLEELVGLVAGQEERETCWEKLHRGPLRHLLIVLKGPLVRPDQFAKAHESMEPD